MKRRPYKATASRVLTLFDREPKLSSLEIGKRLNLNPAYVRKALWRNGRKLARPHGSQYLPETA